jgi:FtsP/CotA-like multicopper oxidase with cupredoxin domain
MHHPIQIDKNRLIRIYLVNILEFDPINNFHLHANVFDFYRTGTKLIPDEYTDIVTMSQGERGILEFSYKYPGKYMFHAHKTEFAEKGWTGLFLVKDETAQSVSKNSNIASIGNTTSNSTSEFDNTTNLGLGGGLQ